MRDRGPGETSKLWKEREGQGTMRHTVNGSDEWQGGDQEAKIGYVWKRS